MSTVELGRPIKFGDVSGAGVRNVPLPEKLPDQRLIDGLPADTMRVRDMLVSDGVRGVTETIASTTGRTPTKEGAVVLNPDMIMVPERNGVPTLVIPDLSDHAKKPWQVLPLDGAAIRDVDDLDGGSHMQIVFPKFFPSEWHGITVPVVDITSEGATLRTIDIEKPLSDGDREIATIAKALGVVHSRIEIPTLAADGSLVEETADSASK